MFSSVADSGNGYANYGQDTLIEDYKSQIAFLERQREKVGKKRDDLRHEVIDLQHEIVKRDKFIRQLAISGAMSKKKLRIKNRKLLLILFIISKMNQVYERY